jgi:hypothetical protein
VSRSHLSFSLSLSLSLSLSYVMADETAAAVAAMYEEHIYVPYTPLTRLLHASMYEEHRYVPV